MKYRLGIVLSGGGVRGLAHAGALQALQEAGLRPDAVAGTSSGAIVGALWAAGYDADDTLDFFERKSPFRFSKVSLGRPGLFDTEKIVPDFREHFPDDRFEALERPLYVTATDLVRARLEIFAGGPLIRPLVASSSVPLMFTPTEIDGTTYVDGGLMNNLPIEPLEGLCDVIVGVYASPIKTVAASSVASTISISQRAFEVAMYHAAKGKFHRCQVLLCPPDLADVPVFGTSRLRDAYEIGHRAAVARIPEIRAALREFGAK